MKAVEYVADTMLINIPFAILMAFGIVYFYAKTNETILCHPYFAWMVAVNATALISYSVDNVLSRLKPLITPLPRIAEALLLLLSLIGGFIGAGLGMLLWDHKTNMKKHWMFFLAILAGLVAHGYIVHLIMTNQLDMSRLTDIMTQLTWALKEINLP